MATLSTPGSYTKNFSWDHSYERLFTSIRNGFSQKLLPVTRETWRADSGIADNDRQLIPLNFFLHSLRGVKEDRVLVDRLVEAAVERRYNKDFAQLALFAFHLARSGHWRGSKWPDGRVAGWANDFISDVAGRKGSWNSAAFHETRLTEFLEEKLDAEPVTRRKVFTNYQFMLESAGVLVDGKLQPPNYAQRWYLDAVQLFWDRHFLDGHLPPGGTSRTLEEAFFDGQIYKLLNCDETQARVFVRTAMREYLPRMLASRVGQLQALRDAGAIAA
jgi:hypothetical protein